MWHFLQGRGGEWGPQRLRAPAPPSYISWETNDREGEALRPGGWGQGHGFKHNFLRERPLMPSLSTGGAWNE